MKRRMLIVVAAWFCIALVDARAAEKPAILSPVLNGASFEGSIISPSGPTPRGSGLAGGSIFVLFGTSLGPAELALGSVPYPDQLPGEPGGTRVTFRSLENQQVYSAPLIHAFASQVSGIVPSPLPVGLAEVTVSYDGVESEPIPVAIVEFSPALFTLSQTGRGPAVVQNYESAASQPLNTLTHPAAPGQYLILWGTGLGAIDGPDNMAPGAGSVRDDVSIKIGGVEIPAEYAGRSPEFPGVDQINVRIPDDGSIALGCYQDLAIQVGNHTRGTQTSVSISDTPGECDHPWGLSAEKLAELDAGGTASFLHMIFTGEFTHVELAKVDAFGVWGNQSVGRLIPAPLPPLAFGGGPCSIATVFQVPIPPGAPPQPLPVRPVPPGHFPLDLGNDLSLAGPGARGLAFSPFRTNPISFGPLLDLAEDFLVSGDWTLSASGGADVPAFEAPFPVLAMPADLLPGSVHLGADLEITWDGSAYSEGDRMWISLEPNPEEPSGAAAKALSCRFEATAGTLEIPASGLAKLEASAGDPLVWQLRVEGPQTFNAEGIDHGQISALVEIEQPAVAAE